MKAESAESRTQDSARSAGSVAGKRASGLTAVGREILGWSKTGARGVRGAIGSAVRNYLQWSRWVQFDPVMRYSAVIPVIEDRFAGLPRAVDIGSGSMGLAFVTQQPVVAVDMQFDATTLLRYRSPIIPVRASASRLPFRDRAFDVTVSMDLMEHLPPTHRAAALREMFRVARRLVIVGFPYGPESAGFDAEALGEEARRGVRLVWREEHVRQGVPGPELSSEILSVASEDPRGAIVREFGHEGLMGIRLRWKLQWIIGRDSRLYGLVFAPLYRIHGWGHRKRAYRRVFVIDIGDEPERVTRVL